MSPLRDEEITTLLRAEVAALDPAPRALDDVVTAGRRRVRGRRGVTGLAALTAAAVVVVGGLELTGPSSDQGLPADRPTVTTTEAPSTSPDPQPVYDAMDERLAAMGLPPDLSAWGAGPTDDGGVALSTSGAGFSLTTTRYPDGQTLTGDPCAEHLTRAAEAQALVGGGDDLPPQSCEEVASDDGELIVIDVDSDGRAESAQFRDGSVTVRADATSSPVVPGDFLARDQLLEIASDPALRWR